MLKKIGIGLGIVIVLFLCARWYVVNVYLGFNLDLKDKVFTKSEMVAYFENELNLDDVYGVLPDKHAEYSKGNFPKMKIFDKDRNELNIVGCFEKFPKVLEKALESQKSLTEKNRYLGKGAENFDKMLQDLVTIKKTSKDINKLSSDYVIVYYFPVFMEKINEEKLKPLIKEYDENLKVDLLIVNVDSIQ
ncbi:MAG: hypothetical protein ACPGSD_12620 [Flavobacteriales bacterium]